MKKIMFAIMLVSSVSSTYASGFSLEEFKAVDIGVKTGAVAAPVPVVPVREETQVPQDLVYRFNQVKSDIGRLSSDTTWLRSDLDRLEGTARRIGQTGKADPFFQSDLQRKAWDISRYASEAQRVGMNVKSLLSQAQRSAELNSIARGIDMDARSLLSRVQFDIENSARRLESTVRSVKPALIGSGAQWSAMNITSSARDLTWKVRDLSYDAQSLVSKTQP